MKQPPSKVSATDGTPDPAGTSPKCGVLLAAIVVNARIGLPQTPRSWTVWDAGHRTDGIVTRRRGGLSGTYEGTPVMRGQRAGAAAALVVTVAVVALPLLPAWATTGSLTRTVLAPAGPVAVLVDQGMVIRLGWRRRTAVREIAEALRWRYTSRHDSWARFRESDPFWAFSGIARNVVTGTSGGRCRHVRQGCVGGDVALADACAIG